MHRGNRPAEAHNMTETSMKYSKCHEAGEAGEGQLSQLRCQCQLTRQPVGQCVLPSSQMGVETWQTSEELHYVSDASATVLH